MPEDRRDFFVSYTGRDQAWATWIARQLEEAGYRTVVQAWDFGAGNFLVAMEDAVATCDRLLPIVSEAYLRARYGRLEWSVYLRQDEASVIPIQVEDIETRSLLGPLRRINLIGQTEESAREKLLREIRAVAGPPSRSPLLRETAAFPGVVARVVAPSPAGDPGADVGAPMGAIPAADAPSRTVEIDRDQLRLVVLGSGEEHRPGVAWLGSLLQVAEEHEFNLYDRDLAAEEQLTLLADYLDGLDPDEVSDVAVTFAGQQNFSAVTGVRLCLRGASEGTPGRSMLLGQLLDQLERQRSRVRVHLILDVTGDGEPFGAIDVSPVPVLVLGGPGSGLARLRAWFSELLDNPDDIGGVVEHGGPLALADLAKIADGVLSAGRDGSSGHDIGLVPNPLAWPAEPPAAGPNWCFVVSESGHRQDRIKQLFEQLGGFSGTLFNRRLARAGLDVRLSAQPGTVRAGKVLGSPLAFSAAVDQVCRAEIAVFDLTNFEPAVMILLGIRAVVRRGVTACVAGNHDPPWEDSEPPFHVREIGVLRQPDRQRVEQRIIAGIRQCAEARDRYTDLPCFELIRGVPPLSSERGRRPYDAGPDPTILALVPFDPRYTELNWKQVCDNLQAAAREEQLRQAEPEDVGEPVLRRTLDLDSPRVISAQLFEGIRLTDFCLVDLTGARPNVLFELGVRLAADELHPVVVVDAEFPLADSESTWWQAVQPQWCQLRKLLVAIDYKPDRVKSFGDMVARHLEFRTLLQDHNHPRVRTVLRGLPPSGVYHLAWRHAVAAAEPNVTPVQARLQSIADTLLVDKSEGRRHLVYPKDHPLSAAAELSGREHLVAAFLYVHFRARAGGGVDAADRERYEEDANRLVTLLMESGGPADVRFARKIEEWIRADESEGSGAEELDPQKLNPQKLNPEKPRTDLSETGPNG